VEGVSSRSGARESTPVCAVRVQASGSPSGQARRPCAQNCYRLLQPGHCPAQARGVADAIADYTRAIELDSNYAKAYLNRGVVRAAEGDRAGAIADYSRAIELDPNYASPYYNTACAYARMADSGQACQWLDKAISLDSNTARAPAPSPPSTASATRLLPGSHCQPTTRLEPPPLLPPTL